ncbi:MAG: TadE family protein [Chloroflexota bacterium]
MKRLLCNRLKLPARGQSLVEMAITAPILIFMLIGVFEVGWALRGYLVLVNVNREITRFAIRPGYMDFSTRASLEESFEKVREWVDTSLTGQLNLDFDDTDGEANATLIISHLVIDTGLPCEDISTCQCDQFTSDPDYEQNSGFPLDNIIIYPGIPAYSYQQARFGPDVTATGPKESRLDYAALAAELAANNNEFNCKLLKRSGVPSSNNVIITELFFDQPQLVGFPLISNPFTDPVPLYTHTAMRVIGGARSAGTAEGSLIAQIDTIGPVCFAYPMLVEDNGSLVNNQPVNLIANGWLKWDYDSSIADEDYLAYALQFPQMSLTNFDDAGGGDDFLQQGSQVDRVTTNYDSLESLVKDLAGKPFVVPTSASPVGSPATVDSFIWVTIDNPEAIDIANGQVPARIDLETELPGGCASP